jgi:hypothetical protein
MIGFTNMSRYFKIDCDKEGKADEATLVEIYAPSPLFTPFSTFSVGVLVGVVITIVFR